MNNLVTNTLAKISINDLFGFSCPPKTQPKKPKQNQEYHSILCNISVFSKVLIVMRIFPCNYFYYFNIRIISSIRTVYLKKHNNQK